MPDHTAYLTGIGDEAGNPIEAQIAAARELGWTTLELRNVQVEGYPTANAHDLPEAAFARAVEQIEAARVRVCCFGSAIANWGKKITDPPDASLAETRRAIPRMQRLGTRLVRVMSYAVREDAEDQLEEERFRRLREITQLFLDAGLQPVHENCMNYGGMGWPFALKLLENVPGLKWVWDTGNPLFNPDRTKPKPWPRQDPWEFYEKVKPWVVHVHVKDVIWDPVIKRETYTWPGDGHAQVRRVLKDLLASGYAGGISIEPHMAAVFHDPTARQASADAQMANYLEYGRRLARLLTDIRLELQSRG